MQTITGFLSFEEGFLCKREALGKVYKGRIAGICVEIHFPCEPTTIKDDPFENTLYSNPLIAPYEFKGWKKGETNIQWGYPVSFPAWDAHVECILIKSCCENDCVDSVTQSIYQVIQRWKRSFLRYCTLCTKQHLYRKRSLREREYCLEIYAPKYVYDMTSRALYADIPVNSNFATVQQIEEAVQFASSGKELLLEYQMLLSAYEARRVYQNRQAIIDACSAVEICLVNKIKAFCIGKGIDPELLLNKYRSLGDRFKLAAKIDKGFPISDFDNVIVKPRNDIAHNRDVYPSDAVTDSLITAVEQCLKHYHTVYY